MTIIGLNTTNYGSGGSRNTEVARLDPRHNRVPNPELGFPSQRWGLCSERCFRPDTPG